MAWSPSALAFVVLGSGLIGVVVAAGALRKRPHPVAWPLAVLMFAVAAWAIPHAISFGFAGAERVAFWHRLRYPGTVVAPVVFLVVALTYAGSEERLSKPVYAALFAVPAVTVVLVWTNRAHGLFWRSLAVERVAGVTTLVPEFGPWYWVNLGYAYLVTAAALLVLAREAIRSGPVYRKQAGLMFLAGLIPLLTNVVVNTSVGPTLGIDLTTTALAITGSVIGLVLFRFDLLEVGAVARDRIVEEIDDGVVAVGPDGSVRDFNPAADRVLGGLSEGQPVEEVFPRETVPDGGEIVAELDGRRRVFRTRSTTVTDESGRDAGRVIYLNDVTDVVEREQRISVLNRILRHNIRNDLNVAAGHLDALAEDATGPEAEHVETARESVERVVGSAEKARDVERTLRADNDPAVADPNAVAERVVADARSRFPGATIEFDPGAAGRVEVVDERLFERTVAELVENAVVHGGREHPRVWVETAAAGDGVRLTVADNGEGIPEDERTVFDVRTESPLEHASGLGLWLVKWTVSLSSGDLEFGRADGRNAVTVEFPAAE